MTTVAGFGSWAKKASRRAKKAAKKASRTAKKASRTVQKAGLRGYKVWNKQQRLQLKMLARIPGMQNIAEAALQANAIERRALTKGQGPSRRSLVRLGKSAGAAAVDVAANAVVPGGSALTASAMAGGRAVLQGRRWDEALETAAAQAARSYGVPPEIAAGALRTARAIGEGGDVRSALAAGGAATASRYLGPRGQQALSLARDLGSGKKLDRVAVQALSRNMPRGATVRVVSPGTMRAAAQAARIVGTAKGAARKRVLRASKELGRRAAAGDPRAQEFASALRRMW